MLARFLSKTRKATVSSKQYCCHFLIFPFQLIMLTYRLDRSVSHELTTGTTHTTRKHSNQLTMESLNGTSYHSSKVTEWINQLNITLIASQSDLAILCGMAEMSCRMRFFDVKLPRVRQSSSKYWTYSMHDVFIYWNITRNGKIAAAYCHHLSSLPVPTQLEKTTCYINTVNKHWTYIDHLRITNSDIVLSEFWLVNLVTSYNSSSISICRPPPAQHHSSWVERQDIKCFWGVWHWKAKQHIVYLKTYDNGNYMYVETKNW